MFNIVDFYNSLLEFIDERLYKLYSDGVLSDKEYDEFYDGAEKIYNEIYIDGDKNNV